MRRGCLNIHNCSEGSMSAVLQHLEDIWATVLITRLNIPRSDIKVRLSSITIYYLRCLSNRLVSPLIAPGWLSPPQENFYRAMLCVSAVFYVVHCLIHLSCTLVYCIDTAEDIVKLISRSGSPIILVFDPECRYPIPYGTASMGAQNVRGWENWQFSNEIAVYLGNGTR